ncbi:hypothetical protein [Hymenobacter chitinivorans]|uniref:Uncharacterized protein n=1 Tax=Hymenobacter chitinivorans DSM 11115 TaxID=1121954 RepID=A0A2M9BQI8_9BACT|nr:hypothetical protein [Hymenobacter chitinivorans]PJJ60223.1 hypothetical protein CLV45_1648 [Hymenobacter chitinivorans DSM 11115]
MTISTPIIAGALLLALLSACDSPAGRTPTASSGSEAPFAGGSGATDPAALSPSATRLPDSLHLISPSQVGRLRLNMKEAELLAVVPAAQLTKTTYSYKGATYPAYRLRDAQQPQAPETVLEFIRSGPDSALTLRRIRIYDPQYRTAEGIGVGSPFGAARQVYGLTRVRQDENDFVAISGQMRIGWILDEKSLPDNHGPDMSTADIPPATRIIGVRVR